MKNAAPCLLVLAILACCLAPAPAQDADPDDFGHPTRRALNEERLAAGFKLSTVVYDRAAKAWRIETDPSERARQAEADALVADVVANGPLVVEPATLEDALVVLAVEPGHAQARQLVRARYAELRQAARAKRGGPR